MGRDLHRWQQFDHVQSSKPQGCNLRAQVLVASDLERENGFDMEENASSTEALTRKLDEILTETENDAGQFCFKEETVEKFMQELYKEIIASPPTPSNAVQVQNDSVGLQVVIGEDKTDEGHFDEDDWLARVLRWGQTLCDLIWIVPVQTSAVCDMLKLVKKYKDAEHVICFLKSLGDSYNIAKTQILLMEPLPSIDHVFCLVLQQERQLNGTILGGPERKARRAMAEAANGFAPSVNSSSPKTRVHNKEKKSRANHFARFRNKCKANTSTSTAAGTSQ
ncbi:hypothetical protein D0Y65_013792 [Glycine soja]|uniref:Uncharacterized protein n=1 Tax=Glycine soja TaxID=3848 RepID=A0A445K5G8_GLYSO|nr:hypothetical protein D0Y65_013792 [Glycine soja]